MLRAVPSSAAAAPWHHPNIYIYASSKHPFHGTTRYSFAVIRLGLDSSRSYRLVGNVESPVSTRMCFIDAIAAANGLDLATHPPLMRRIGLIPKSVEYERIRIISKLCMWNEKICSVGHEQLHFLSYS